MVQSASMGPPMSPRETRRSGRRSAPSAASKSPDSDQPPPKERASSSRTTSSSTLNRTKKNKLEDDDEGGEERKHTSVSSASSVSTIGNGNIAKPKRKGTKDKDKDKDKSSNSSATAEDVETVTADDQPQDPAEDEEEQGITRCVCGSSEDDPDAGEFMVQCEDCKVWQHGPCMGYQTEAQIPEDDYYCEQCRPDMHVELVKKLAKRPRQASGTSATSRVSRSHSPTQLLKQQTSKRRNTMNSRDAAFDESLKEVLEATAAEAAGLDGTPGVPDTVNALADQDLVDNKKKRKRTEDDLASTKKRTRSASTTSDRQSVIATFVEPAPPEKPSAPQTAPAKSNAGSSAASGGSKNKRNGRKILTVEVAATESEDGTNSVPAPPPSKKSNSSSRAKSSTAPKRPPISQSVSGSASASVQNPPSSITHEASATVTSSTTNITAPPTTSTRRNAGGSSAAEARAYRQTHAYAVSQQTLYTSWNLPDYLSHLEQMLPSDTPQPLELRAGGGVRLGSSSSGGPGGNTNSNSGSTSNSGAGTAADTGPERMMERGVKVKWPAKRMSVVDMNKRVRALVEWVGREQASALDRGRRREALERALREVGEKERERAERKTAVPRGAGDGEVEDVEMLDAGDGYPNSERQEKDDDDDDDDAELVARAAEFVTPELSNGALEMSGQTMKMMEELMEELIGFQERFGPGATKVRERERRAAVVAA